MYGNCLLEAKVYGLLFERNFKFYLLKLEIK